jgi:phenylpyruvate tautomerase PptA (4-oxalocrotonate tautomerase family)
MAAVALWGVVKDKTQIVKDTTRIVKDTTQIPKDTTPVVAICTFNDTFN